MTAKKLVYYKSVLCPFCREAGRRIRELQAQYGLDVEEIDVTWQPTLLLKKGISAVPVVECDGQTFTGLPTTKQLKELIGLPP